MTTRQTPDAVREGLFAGWSTKTLADQCHMQAREHLDPEFTQFMTAVGNRLAALDSRAGDAGEEDRYTVGYAQGQADATQLHQWMQDKAWQDTVLMLVHYQRLAERTWLVGHEEAAAKLAKWWRHARALSATKSVEDIAATPAPAVDAVPAGEVERQAIRNEIINAPETADFMAGVPLEAAHQRERWGADHDAGKMPLDWFWLIGFLAQKAADAAMRGDIKKAKHHTISTGAALANWHAALTGADIKMRPGISAEAQAAAEGRGALSLALQTDALLHGEGRK
jgi:DNA-binding transcriptional regulator YdaS (Cro superfamily)